MKTKEARGIRFPRTWAELRSHPIVSEISDERLYTRRSSYDKQNECENGDGIWVYFIGGFCNGENAAHGHSPESCLHQIHEDTLADILREFRSVTPCDCKECVDEAHGLAINEPR